MAFLLSFRLPAAFLLGTALLGGCCANNVCDCPDERADEVRLVFSPAFTAADLDTIVLQRTPLPFSATAKPETVTLIRTAAQAPDTLVLDSGTPFAQVGSTKLSRYRYLLQYYTQAPGKKPEATTVLVIDSIRLKGSFEGTGCCTCYTNTLKTVFARKPGQAQNTAFDLRQAPRVLPVAK